MYIHRIVGRTSDVVGENKRLTAIGAICTNTKMNLVESWALNIDKLHMVSMGILYITYSSKRCESNGNFGFRLCVS